MLSTVTNYERRISDSQVKPDQICNFSDWKSTPAVLVKKKTKTKLEIMFHARVAQVKTRRCFISIYRFAKATSSSFHPYLSAEQLSTCPTPDTVCWRSTHVSTVTPPAVLPLTL